MNCISCGLEMGNEITCPRCGYDNTVLHKAARISNAYYNKGLDKAQIRDMSGAIDMLERSLKFNKRNIDARNLLGLVYFETGEVVAALSEWVISKNLKTERNIASDYIEKLRANPQRLENIQKTIKRYNRALDSCRIGEDDSAVIMLKKVVEANPKLIKAQYLLSLLYMKSGDYKKARSILKKALPIDRTNSTALRFLKEIDEQTGMLTDTDELRKGIIKDRKKGFFNFFKRDKYAEEEHGGYTTLSWDDEERIITEPVVQPIARRGSAAFAGLVNLVIGIVLGVLVIGFIAVPAVKRSTSRQSLQAQTEAVAVEGLLQAYIQYDEKDYDSAMDTLLSIDTAALSEESAVKYNEVLNSVNNALKEADD